MGRINYVNSQGNVKAGTTVFCYSALHFSQFYLSKAVFIHIGRSPRFIPSPCFILSPEFSFYTQPLFDTQSAVSSPQSAVHILYWQVVKDKITSTKHLQSVFMLVQNILITRAPRPEICLSTTSGNHTINHVRGTDHETIHNQPDTMFPHLIRAKYHHI